ncbi:MAG TPA: hypothetical protein VLV15_05825, partial [Dongiaceae bacterium]|nr:hypothetical protein [Dongiaceae bacterium]
MWRDPRIDVARLALALALLAGGVTPAAARVTRVAARDTLARVALAAARPGDTLVLVSGTHHGPLVLHVPVTLRGEPGAVVSGGGHGTVIAVGAPGSRIEDLIVRGSGRQVLSVDAGVYVQCGGVTLSRLTLDDVLYGIYAERADGLAVDG